MLRLVTIDLEGADIAAFEAYEDRVLPLLKTHGASLQLRVRAVDQSLETHLINFEDQAAYEAYLADPDRLVARPLWEKSGASAHSVEVQAK